MAVHIQAKFKNAAVAHEKSSITSKGDLRVDLNKTTLILFTRNITRKSSEIKLSGTKISSADEVKYIWVVLDIKLTCNSQLKRTVGKSNKPLRAARRSVLEKLGTIICNDETFTLVYTIYGCAMRLSFVRLAPIGDMPNHSDYGLEVVMSI